MTSTLTPTEPPFFTGISDMEPNDDFGEPKKRDTLENVAAQFRKHFEDEPWFVRILLPADTRGYLVVVADASYWPKVPVKYRPFMGYPVAVALLQGLPANEERKKLGSMREQQESDPQLSGKQERLVARLQRACEEFFEKYKDTKWLISVNWHLNNNTPHLEAVVDGRTFPDPKPSKRGARFGCFPLVITKVPGKLIEKEEGGNEF